MLSRTFKRFRKYTISYHAFFHVVWSVAHTRQAELDCLLHPIHLQPPGGSDRFHLVRSVSDISCIFLPPWFHALACYFSHRSINLGTFEMNRQTHVHSSLSPWGFFFIFILILMMNGSIKTVSVTLSSSLLLFTLHTSLPVLLKFGVRSVTFCNKTGILLLNSHHPSGSLNNHPHLPLSFPPAGSWSGFWKQQLFSGSTPNGSSELT